MKRERKTNLKSLLLVLLITLVLLIASTYAWFTANQTVSINQLEVNVEATSGLQISTDAQNWKSVLTTADLAEATVDATYSTNVNQIPTSMEPVSTAGNVTVGRLDMFYGIVEANEVTGKFDLTAAQQTDQKGSDGKYIAFDIFLQVNTDTPIFLTTNSTVVSVGDSKGLENAARVAFLTQGNVPIGSAPATAQALNSATSSNVFLWEPNADTHTSAAVQNALSVYGLTTTETGAGPLPYVGIKAPIGLADGVTIDTTAAATAFFNPVTPDLSTPKNMGTDRTFMTLNTGITKVRVYMWVEGEDVDCENNASGTDIGYNLQFTAVEP